MCVRPLAGIAQAWQGKEEHSMEDDGAKDGVAECPVVPIVAARSRIRHCAHGATQYSTWPAPTARSTLKATVRRSTENWRRERDSNPRYRKRYNRFRVCRIRPLCHLSAA